MRNKIIIISLLLSISVSVSAQLVSVITDASLVFPTTIDGTIVRNYNDQYAVGFLIENGISYFYSTDIQSFSTYSPSFPLTSGTKMKLTYNWVIKDMQVYGEYIYFCGTDGFNRGLYGRIHISDLLNSGNHFLSSVYYYSYTTTLKKIAVVDKGTTIGLVFVGEQINSGILHDVIVEVPDFEYSANVIGFATLPAVSSIQRETLQDVLIVGPYAVFIGMDFRTTHNTFFVRRSDKNNVILDSELRYTHHYYPVSTGEQVIPQTLTCSAVVEERKISIAHLCNRQGGTTSLVINTIDPVYTMNSITVQRYNNTGRLSLTEMKYLPRTENLVLLYSAPSGSNSNFLLWHPLNTTPYSTKILFDNNNMYTSIDLLVRDSFLSVCRSLWFLQRDILPLISSSCLPLRDASIGIDPQYQKVDNLEPPSYLFPPSNPLYDTSITSPILLEVDCEL